MSDEVRYRENDAAQNAILRLALLEAWNGRCYWEPTPLDFQNTEIDHIIPHTISGPELQQLLIHHASVTVRGKFDLHAVGNLAPICRPCNAKKRNLNLMETGQVTIALQTAYDRRNKVEQYVRSFNSSNKVSRALVVVAQADFTDKDSSDALRERWSSVTRTLSANAPELLTQYSTVYEIKIQNPDAYNPARVQVNLDEGGRRARVVLEDVYKKNLDDVLLEVTTAMQDGLITRLQADITADLGKYGHFYPTVGDPEGWSLIEVDGFSYEHPDDFTVQGTFEIDMSAAVSVHSDTTDSGSDLLQCDAVAHGRFSISFTQDDTDPAHLDVDDLVIDDWQKGPAPR